MKRLSLSLPLLLVLAAAPGRTIGQDPKPAPAIVTMTDTVTGMSKLDKDKMELRLNNAPGKGSILTAPLVLVDETKTKVNAFGKKPVAFVGELKLTEVVIGMTGSIPPGKIKAKALYLVATEAAEITDDNKAKFPAAGMARVQGTIKTGEFAAGKTVKAAHAIANGEHPILLLDKSGMPLQNVPKDGNVVAIGRLRIADNGAIVLDAESVEKAGESK